MHENKNSTTLKKKGFALKIIIIVAIAAVIITIGVIKNREAEPQTQSATPNATSPAGEQSSGQMTETDNADFDLLASEIDLEQLKSYELPIIIDFGADECVPCKEMAPVLKRLNEEWRGKVIVKFVDVWKNPDAAYKFPVSLIPTQFIFDAEGNPFIPSEKLKNEIPFNLYTLKDSEEHVFTTHEGGLTEKQLSSIFAEMGVLE